MTNLIISVALVAITLTSCNSGGNKPGSPEVKTDSGITKPKTVMVYSCPMHPEVTGNKGDECPKCGMELTEVNGNTTQASNTATTHAKATVSIKEIVNDYLQMKDAFTKDNSNDAAKAGTMLEAAFKSFDKTVLTADEKKVYEDIADDAREHAEHIGKNAGNIAHQREHFAMLSKDIYDLVKAFGSEKILYKDFCPMYDHKKGAYWISETKEIKNPYFGKSMPNCGSVKEEIKPK